MSLCPTSAGAVIPAGLYMFANSVVCPTEKLMIARWTREYEKKQQKRARREAVLHAVGEGYDTLEEISFATNMSQSTVYRLTRRLIAEKKLVSRTVKNQNSQNELHFDLA